MLEGYVYLIITINETMTTVVHRHVFLYLDDCSEWVSEWESESNYDIALIEQAEWRVFRPISRPSV